ncbi:MAG: TIGR03089 family protein [Actinomycetaceae bacterium]|nr:TIGR03089 family protein [Actinomycetaceae bacterium]
MFDFSHLQKLRENRSAVLTWYDDNGRVELVGPVVTRWISKTAHYLVDLFGEGAQPSVLIHLPPSWRTVMWVTGAGFAGADVQIVGADRPVHSAREFDLVVTSSASTARDLARDPGLIVVLQALKPFALQWEGELPAGVADAIGEVSSQPDFIQFTDVSALPTHEADCDQHHTKGSRCGAVLTDGSPTYIQCIWQAWEQGLSALWIDPTLDQEPILRQELIID